MIKEINIFDYAEVKQYDYEDIENLLSEIECPINKFLANVRKIVKLKNSCTLWFGFSEQLQNEYGFKNKDEYANIKGEFKTDYNGRKYNFQCIPITSKYCCYYCLEIEINNGIVKVKNSFRKSV